MKISAWWLLAALSVGILFTFIYLEFIHTPDETFTVNERKDFDIITLKLPRTIETTVFGPKYWEAYHRLTERIPCSGCREKAVPFMKFFHDIVNQATGKEIVYKENFNKHLDGLSKLQRA